MLNAFFAAYRLLWGLVGTQGMLSTDRNKKSMMKKQACRHDERFDAKGESMWGEVGRKGVLAEPGGRGGGGGHSKRAVLCQRQEVALFWMSALAQCMTQQDDSNYRQASESVQHVISSCDTPVCS